MKRVHDAAWPIIGLVAVAVSSWLLFKDLRGLSFASLKSALFSISPTRWLLAIGSTSFAYAALAWYDQIALLHLGRRLSWRYVAVASFTAYALAHNIGASVLSGAVVRYRAYSEKGLSVGEIGVLVAFCSFTFALGAATVGGFSLLFHPELVERFGGAPLWLGQVGAAALVAAPSLYVVGSLLHFPPLKIGAYELVYPRPPVAARQLLGPPSGAGRRVRHHLFRASGGRQSRLCGRARGLCRLVFDRAHEPRARGPRRARVHLCRSDAGRAAAQCRRRPLGVPASVSDPAADVRARGRLEL
jgi:glycosyltransferase 2 family protein